MNIIDSTTKNQTVHHKAGSIYYNPKLSREGKDYYLLAETFIEPNQYFFVNLKDGVASPKYYTSLQEVEDDNIDDVEVDGSFVIK